MAYSFIGRARHTSPFSRDPPAEGEHSQQAGEPCPAGATGRFPRPRSTSAALINDSHLRELPLSAIAFTYWARPAYPVRSPLPLSSESSARFVQTQAAARQTFRKIPNFNVASRAYLPHWQNQRVVMRQTLPVGMSLLACNRVRSIVSGDAFCEDSGVCIC